MRTVISISLLAFGLFLGSSTAQALSFTPYIDLTALGDAYMLSSESKDYNNGQLHGRFKLLSQEESLKIYMDLGAGGLVGDRAESYFILPQAYITYQMTEGASVTFGRIIKSYSVMDDYWMLGDISPLFRWDAARPEIQGLSGLFLELKGNKNIQFETYVSYLHVPSQGPSYSLVDGKLTSGNPWFSRPVDILALSGVPYDLRYTVRMPDVSDIVLQPSAGAVLTLQSDSGMFWGRGGYFLKNRNEIALPFEGTVNIPAETADITVHPQVAEHKLATLDGGVKLENWSFSVSGIYESDVKFDVLPNWIHPSYSDQYKLGANVTWQVTPFHTLETGWIKTYNNTVEVKNLPGSSNLDIYSFRNQYDAAVDVRWTSVFSPRQYGFMFKTKLRIAYDYEVDNAFVSFEGIYKPLEEVSLFVRGDFFGGDKTSTEIYNNLMVAYLNKDRVQMGVQYVF